MRTWWTRGRAGAVAVCDPDNSPPFKAEDEIDELFSRASPNPSRIGCPPREVVIALARRKGEPGNPAYEHLAHCSPCYKDFRRFQGPAPDLLDQIRRRRIKMFASAAAFAVIVGGGLWTLRLARTQPTIPEPTRPSVETPILRTRADLRRFTITRGEPSPVGVEPVELPRAKQEITILLRPGFELGRYEIRILDSALLPRVSGVGEARIVDHITTLQSTLDLGSLSPGGYQLTLRRDGGDWRLFPAVIK